MSGDTKDHNKEPSVFVCPDRYTGSSLSVFLAGGITDCPDWQTYMKDKIVKDLPGLIVLNPRRASFDVTNKSALKEQITWEYDALRQAELILFWFPKGPSVCPIALFELGTWSIKHIHHCNNIIVGCDPEYKRREDVETQLHLVMGDHFVVHSTLDELFGAMQKYFESLFEF